MQRQQRDMLAAISLVVVFLIGLMAWVIYLRRDPGPPMQVTGASAGTLPTFTEPSPPNSSPPTAPPAPPPPSPLPVSLRVHVVGAVRKSGVYTLPAGARVDDAVKQAGGATTDADLERINLADTLKDGEQVRIPHQRERRAPPVLTAAPRPARRPLPTTTPPANYRSTARYPLDVGAPAPTASGSAAPAAATSGGKVNLNSANAEELDTLPGVGPATAGAILDYRKEHGRFLRIEDIMEVRGIGEKKFEKMKDRLTVK